MKIDLDKHGLHTDGSAGEPPIGQLTRACA